MFMSESLQRYLELQEIEFNAYAIGEEKGIEQNKREMIISLNNQGVSLDIISKASNLTIPEVEQIINEK